MRLPIVSLLVVALFSSSAFAIQRSAKCANLNMANDPTKSVYHWKNPDAGCDLGLELPGLPKFGLSTDLSACKVMKAVTSDMVSKANAQMQQSVDAATKAATGGTGQTNADVDLSKEAEGVIIKN